MGTFVDTAECHSTVKLGWMHRKFLLALFVEIE